MDRAVKINFIGGKTKGGHHRKKWSKHYFVGKTTEFITGKYLWYDTSMFARSEGKCRHRSTVFEAK